jgi:tetratricopeptide (TPR) repeat protein
MAPPTPDQAALQRYQNILAVQPNDPVALGGMGLHFMQRFEWDMAIQWFDRAVAADLTSAQFYADLGEALRRAGMTDPAIASLERALALQPDLAPATESLKSALTEKRLWDAAEAASQARRLVVVTLHQAADKEAFHRWREAVIKNANPFRIYVVNRGLPAMNGDDCRWINLSDDAGSSIALMSDASSALLLGCLLACHERADLLYAPLDGPPGEGSLDKLYEDSQESGIAGAEAATPLLIRLDFLIQFVAQFITRSPTGGPDRMQEKIAGICRSARIAALQTPRDQVPPDRVQESCRQILRADLNNVAALQRMSVYAAQTCRPDMAMRWLIRAVESAPDRADVLADLGDAFCRFGLPARAVGCFQRALELNPHLAGAADKLRIAMEDHRRFDSAPTPGGRASRYIIVTGYHSDGSSSAPEDFFRLWYDNTIKYAKPHRIYVINAASKPVDYGDCRWINLSENLGHVSGMSRRQQLGGASLSHLLGCMLAYLERADFIYKEQDCLAFGDYIERLYTEIGPAGFITGRTNENGPAAGLLGISLLLGKLAFLPEFIARYASLRSSDVDLVPEFKIAEMTRLARTQMGYDRSRPFNLRDPGFYVQKLTAEELTTLRGAGLI